MKTLSNYVLATWTTFILFFLFIISANCQVYETFNDGDISNNPNWSGEASKFIVENRELRLLDINSTGSAFIATRSTSINNAMWELSFNLGFNPSGSNYFDFVLISDSQNLGTQFSGYFVRVGAGTDNISLYYASGSTIEKLIEGSLDRLDFSGVGGKIRVTRDAIGYWQLFSDISGAGAFTLEGETIHAKLVKSEWTGIRCKYTSSRSDKFYFDDIMISGDPFIDLERPTLSSIEVSESNRIKLVFSEGVTNGEDQSSYSLNQEGIKPATVIRNLENYELIFLKDFGEGLNNSLKITEIADAAGNIIKDTTVFFRYIEPRVNSYRDIIINEIMADPEPTQKLPAAEFIEIFNRSESPIDLTNWKICDETKCGIIGSGYALSQDYAVVTSRENERQFDSSLNLALCDSWPSINNSGEVLKLVDSNNKIIDSVDFALSWMNPGKRNGGWTLERVDPEYLCISKLNWSSSVSEMGGTPGTKNSVFASLNDSSSPKVSEAWYDEEFGITVKLNEQFYVPKSLNIKFDPPLNQALNLIISPDSIRLLDISLPDRTIYQLRIEGISDCSGNISDGTNFFELAKTGMPKKGEVLINELLFNPPPNGIDFIEILNTSEDYFDLFDLMTGSVRDGKLYSPRPLSAYHVLFKPKKHFAIAVSDSILFNQYPNANLENFVETVIPSMPNDEGTVLVFTDSLVIDSVHYSDDWHFSLLPDVEGISLERLSGSLDSNNPELWSSATSNTGYGTPGYQNSHHSIPDPAGKIRIDPKVILPGYTGDHDLARIDFKLGSGSWMVTAMIYSFGGLVAKSLANNWWIGSSGTFFWDGTLDNGNKAPIGIYLLLIEAFNNNGKIVRLKEKVYIGSRFD